jgi:haloacid dehalogenase superfamily, subfamily IA, variant 1 with third motif having Dx(3-4)D or Dx(3-4)E
MKIIVFDLDDTLFNEIDYLQSAFKEIARYIESNFHKINIYNFMLNCFYENKNVFTEINNCYSLQVPTKDYISIYRRHFPDIKLNQGVRDTLIGLKKEKNIIGLITDGRSISQRNKIKALGLDNIFSNDNIVISEEFGTEKPNFKNYEYFHDKYPNASYYYIGDNTNKDFLAPNLLGWTSICLLDNGQNIHKQNFTLKKEFLPTFKINNIKDLINVI